MNFASTLNVSSGTASGRFGSGGFSTNLAADNIKTPAFKQYASDVMSQMATALFKEQADIAQTFLTIRTGELVGHLRSNPFDIIETGTGVQLDLKYMLKVRFIDLKRTGTSKPKRNYVQLYNRLVWGYCYGRLFPQLKYGFTHLVKESYLNQLRQIYSDKL